MPKPLSLPFDPIARADELWKQRWGGVPSMSAITSIMRAHQIHSEGRTQSLRYDHGNTPFGYENHILIMVVTGTPGKCGRVE